MEKYAFLKENLKNAPKYHIYPNLKLVERLTISSIYKKKWKKLVKKADLSPTLAISYEYYFKEIHANYYKKIITKSKFVSVYRLILNFLISRVNENLRLALFACQSYNLTGIVLAVRSQIEVNALLFKFSEIEYLKKFISLNEDRTIKDKNVDTVININTLVTKLDKHAKANINFEGYEKIYADLSLLLHPNPSAVKFYAQAFRGQAETSVIAQPNLSYFFEETIVKDKYTSAWFEEQNVFLLSFVEHFLAMLNEMPKKDFFINSQEQEHAQTIALSNLITKHQKEILKVANDSEKNGKNTEEEINKKLKEIIDSLQSK